MDAVDAAWLAGFLDGEGVFQIVESRRTNTGPSYAPQISATSTDRKLTERCKDIAGGWIYAVASRDERWKSSYRWTLKGRRLGPVLEDVIPHLVGKREQAEILLALRREITPGARAGEWGRVYDAETVARREQMKSAIHALNHRGGLPVPIEQQEALEAVRRSRAVAGSVA